MDMTNTVALRSIFVIALSLVTGCDRGDSDGNKGPKPALKVQLPMVTPLELTAKAALEKREKERQATLALEKRVKSAMEIVLLDPFSAQYRALRTGKSLAVCGQVNGKNRLGSYVGFKDFVLGRDGKTVWLSRSADGVESELYSSFAEAYIGACASKAEVARHKAATAPQDYYADDAYNAATDAASAAADAVAESVELPPEEI